MIKKKQIPIVRDSLTNEDVLSELLDEIFEQHELQAIRTDKEKSNRFLCGLCKQKVTLYSVSAPEFRFGHRYHFQHPPGIECDWKSDTKTRAEIYRGIDEGKKHWEMKKLLAETLIELDGWEVIDVDKKFVFSADRLRRAKPDLHARIDGKDVVFEIQLRSESPQTIIDRKAFYKSKGWRLIWLSAENSQIVSESFAEDCIDTKQVQKDIAFTNRGNWFIFDTLLAEKSKEEGDLRLLAKIWEPQQVHNKIEYDWREQEIIYSELQFEDGDTFFQDFFQRDRELKIQLKEEGKRAVEHGLPTWVPKNWTQFLQSAKVVWPTLDMNTDEDWLHKLYKEDLENRELTLKTTILSFFRSDSWREHNNPSYWGKIANKVQGLGFGIYESADLRIVDKLLLILGYPLSEHLNPNKSSHIQSCHYFFDKESFSKYRQLCLDAINYSPYKDEIISHHTMVKRMNAKGEDIEQKHDLDEFLAWFCGSTMPTYTYEIPQKPPEQYQLLS
ncbi:MAG: DUF6035 family protein [Colwellia sp.]